MLEIRINGRDYFDEVNEEFISIPPTVIQLEHSLFSISKWEKKWHKPFVGKSNKTEEELLDYIKCMTLNEVDDYVYMFLTEKDVESIKEYMEDEQSATVFNEDENKTYSKKIITSEEMYSWLVNLQIPFEVQYWHLNRMTNLVRILNEQNSPKKKKSQEQILRENKARNAERRARMNSKG